MGKINYVFIILIIVLVMISVASHFYFTAPPSNNDIKDFFKPIEKNASYYKSDGYIQTQDEAFEKKVAHDVNSSNLSLLDYQKLASHIAPSGIVRSEVDPDVVRGYPVKCRSRLGFDNYRTEQTFVINPANNKEMYINVEYMGLYKSSDGGQSWSFAGKGLKGLPREDDPSQPCYDLRFHLYIDSKNPRRLLAPGGSAPGKVGAGLGGLSESLDGGITWHQLFSPAMSAYTESIALHPIDSKTIYVTTSALPQGMDGPDKGKIFVVRGVVYKTTDSGITWDELPTGYFNNMRASGIFLDSKNSNRLRLATFGLPAGNEIGKKTTEEQWGFLETLDGGKTWTRHEPTNGIGIRHVAVSPANLDHYFMMASKENEDKVYYSLDGTPREATSMTVNFARYDPHDATGMRLIGINLYAQPNDLFESNDGGANWYVIGKLPVGISNDNRVSNIVFDPLDRNVIYINSNFARVWKSRDRGITWQQLLSLDKLK